MSETNKQAETPEQKDSDLTIGERIQKARKRLGLSVEQLTMVILRYDRETEPENEKGISVSSLYLYEKGDRFPRAKEIKLLCLSLDVSADWLLFGKLWNSRQEADSELANNLRALIKQASDEQGFQSFFDETSARTRNHREIIIDVKNKT